MAGGPTRGGRRGPRGGRGTRSAQSSRFTAEEKGKQKVDSNPPQIEPPLSEPTPLQFEPTPHSIEKPSSDRNAFYDFGEKLPDNFRFRPSCDNIISVHVWHKGYFVTEPTLQYLSGLCKTVSEWDIDLINSIEVGKLVNSLGYGAYKGLWYVHPGLGLLNGRKPFNNDEDVIAFLADIQGHQSVDIYVERSEGESVRDIQSEVQFVNLSEASQIEVATSQIEVTTSHIVQADIEAQVQSEEAEGEGGKEAQVQSEGVKEPEFPESEGDTESDPDYEADTSDTDVSLDDSDYDENWEWASVLPPEIIQFEANRVVGNNGDALGEIVQGFDNHARDSEELNTPPRSDEDFDDERPKFQKFKPNPEGGEVKFEVGQIFTSVELFKDAVRDYALNAKKNDRKRIVVKCGKDGNECPFYLRAVKYEENTYFQLVTCNTEHTCHRTAKNRQAKTQWLAKSFVPLIRNTPTIKIGALVDEARNRWGIVLSRFQVNRAKMRATEMIDGAIIEQYRHLRNYAEELLKSNPGSTVIIKSTLGPDGPVFERIYVCFEACKRAFATTCRPLIGLDDCFLKGTYGGQLLTAVGKDGNNQMLPIASAIVEAETKDSWSWFLDLLMNDLNTINHKSWCFISDQQKENTQVLHPEQRASGSGSGVQAQQAPAQQAPAQPAPAQTAPAQPAQAPTGRTTRGGATTRAVSERGRGRGRATRAASSRGVTFVTRAGSSRGRGRGRPPTQHQAAPVQPSQTTSIITSQAPTAQPPSTSAPPTGGLRKRQRVGVGTQESTNA